MRKDTCYELCVLADNARPANARVENSERKRWRGFLSQLLSHVLGKGFRSVRDPPTNLTLLEIARRP